MMKKFMKKLWEKKDSKKGFTLVELIVVLVILAILAAIMVPALLGWIDKAKEKQYVLEARGIYMAAQAKASEQYATVATAPTVSTEYADIAKMADVTIDAAGDLTITYKTTTDTDPVAIRHAAFTIDGITVKFTSSDGSVVQATMDGGNSWTITSVSK